MLLLGRERRPAWTPRRSTYRGYSLREEIANSVSHGLGILPAMTGLVVLMARSMEHGDIWTLVGCAIFGVTLILPLHGLDPLPLHPGAARQGGAAAARPFRDLSPDRRHLYPFTLVNLRGAWGWSLLAVIWASPCWGSTCGPSCARARPRPS